MHPVRKEKVEHLDLHKKSETWWALGTCLND